MKIRKPHDISSKYPSAWPGRPETGQRRSPKRSQAEIDAAKHFFEAKPSPAWPETALQKRMQSSGG
jgi:hypothetical protein